MFTPYDPDNDYLKKEEKKRKCLEKHRLNILRDYIREGSNIPVSWCVIHTNQGDGVTKELQRNYQGIIAESWL